MLEGYRIVELGQVIAGTVSGMILADLGAEVIKVEPPKGDLGRNPTIARIGDTSGIFLTFNRGKKSIALDLKKAEGKEAFLGLVEKSDAVMSNFRPGTMERLGLGFEVLRERNPDLVCVESSGYGRKGPWRDMPAYDIIQQAISGHMSITGEAGGPPVRLGSPVSDISTALYCTIACMAGLLGRNRRGTPACLEVPMFDVQLAMLGYYPTMYLTRGEQPQRMGSAHKYMVPHEVYPTKTCYIVLNPREEHFWKKMCDAMGLPEIAGDPRFMTNDLRVQNRQELVSLLTREFLARTGEEWMAVFRQAGVPCAPVNTVAQAIENEQVEARELLRGFDYPGVGPVRMIGNPILDLQAARNPDPRPAPLLGEHTREILTGLLRFPRERAERLISEGAAFSPACTRQ